MPGVTFTGPIRVRERPDAQPKQLTDNAPITDLDPATATTADVAAKVNEILNALRNAGIIRSS